MSTVVQLVNSLITVFDAHTVKYPNNKHFVNNIKAAVVPIGTEVVKISFVERSIFLCPYVGGSPIRGVTAVALK